MMETPPAPAPRYLEVPIGLVSGLISVGLLILVFGFAYISAEKSSVPDTPIMIVAVVMAVLGVFFSMVSYRLLTKRGSRTGGGLLSPTGWKIVGMIFVGLALLLGIGGWWQGDLRTFMTSFIGVAFARLCFTAAQRGSTKQATELASRSAEHPPSS